MSDWLCRTGGRKLFLLALLFGSWWGLVTDARSPPKFQLLWATHS